MGPPPITPPIYTKLAPAGSRGRHAICLILSIILSLTGCSSVQPVPPVWPAINPAETPRLDPDSLAVVLVRFEPAGSQGPLLPTKGETTAQGAAAGAVAGTLYTFEAIVTLGPLAALLLPIMVPVGIVAGAAAGHAEGSPPQEIKHSAQDWQKAMSSLHMQERLRTKLMAALSEAQASPQLRLYADAGPTTPDEKPTYREFKEQTVLEAGVVRVELVPLGQDRKENSYRLAVTTHARAVDPSRQLVLDEMTHVFRSPAHTVSEWLQDNATAFTQAMNDAMEETAHDIVTEFFRIYYPPASAEPGDSRQSAVPYFYLQPLYPGVDRWPWTSTTQVDSLRPTLRWESFPRSFDLSSSNGQAIQFTQVSYDLALYSVNANTVREEPSTTHFVPGPLVLQVTGLTEPRYRLEEPLVPCGRYAWTIRARFLLNGHPRWTEWSDIDLFVPPWMGRRNFEQTLRSYFLQFRAPPEKDGKECRDD